MATGHKVNGIDIDTIFADMTTNMIAGNGLTGGGTLAGDRTFSVGAGGGITVSANAVAHADTSNQGSVNNSGNTVIQDITLDAYGHVTGLTSATIGGGTMTSFQVEDGDGTEVTINNAKEWKFVEAGGININWTDTSNGTDGDPFDLSFNVTSAPKWTTARTLTTTLTGDVTGSASMSVDGTGNRTTSITTVVANDSHTHDGRYYTESESNARYLGISSNAVSATKWATARTLGVTLTGDVTGSGSMSVDGTGNKTASIACDVSSITGNLSVSGSITAGGNVTGYSDKRLKSNIVRIEDALDKVCAMGGYVYDKAESIGSDVTIKETGVIAQEVQAVLPEAVQYKEEDPDKILAVAHGSMVGILIEAIKELKAEVDALKKGV